MSSGRRCVVVGAGVLGLSAAWSLSQRGWSVEVLEAGAGIGHPRAGSRGDARIFRLGYPEAHYVELAIAARTLWRELEASTGRSLLHVTGQLSFGDAGAVDAVADSLRSHGEAIERLTGDEAAARFSGVAVPNAGPVLYEPRSGVLAADECLRALTEAGRFEVQSETHVTWIEPGDEDEGATVCCADGRSIRADVVVDCAGPDSLRLLGDDVLVAGAPPSLPQVAYFRAAKPGRGRQADQHRLPVFIEWSDAMVYGLPVLGAGPHAGTFKVSHHTPGPVLLGYDPRPAAATTSAFDADDAAHLATLTSAVRRLLPELDPEPVATERCVYDNSVDGDFVVDRVGNVVVGCGTSGHGFKFGPLLGELMADLAEGTVPRWDLRPFRLNRVNR